MNAYELADALQKDGLNNDNHGLFSKRIQNMLRQQADRLAKYEAVLQAIANEYPELSDHKIQVQNRNHIKWAKEALHED